MSLYYLISDIFVVQKNSSNKTKDHKCKWFQNVSKQASQSHIVACDYHKQQFYILTVYTV